MPTGQHLTIDQGGTFAQAVAVDTAYNGLTPQAVIRAGFGREVLATLTCTAISAGSTTVSLTADQTAALDAPAGSDPYAADVRIGVWDLVVVSGLTVTPLVRGQVFLRPGSTAPTL